MIDYLFIKFEANIKIFKFIDKFEASESYFIQ